MTKRKLTSLYRRVERVRKNIRGELDAISEASAAVAGEVDCELDAIAADIAGEAESAGRFEERLSKLERAYPHLSETVEMLKTVATSLVEVAEVHYGVDDDDSGVIERPL